MSHFLPGADYEESIFSVCLHTNGTSFVYTSGSLNCLYMLAVKKLVTSKCGYLKAFLQTQGDLFSRVRHATLALVVLWSHAMVASMH